MTETSHNADYIDVSDEPMAVRVLYPHESFWLSYEEKVEEKRTYIEENVDSNSDVVLVHDTDCDGLGTAVIVEAEHESVSRVPKGHNEDVTIGAVGEILNDYMVSNPRVIITDSGPKTPIEEYIDPYLEFASEVFVYDHHQWEDRAIDYLEEIQNVEYVVDPERCAAKIVFDEYMTDKTEKMREFAEVTQDHDLWIKEDNRSDTLADYSYAVSYDEYIEMGVEYGISLLSLESVRKQLFAQRETTQKKLNLALRRSRFYDVEGVTVAITYGRCPKSDVGNVLYSEYNADIVCMQFPSGKISFRSPGNGFAHKMATAMGGGGHDNAAGGYYEEELYEGKTQFEAYWGTMGRNLDDVLLDVAREELT